MDYLSFDRQCLLFLSIQLDQWVHNSFQSPCVLTKLFRHRKIDVQWTVFHVKKNYFFSFSCRHFTAPFLRKRTSSVSNDQFVQYQNVDMVANRYFIWSLIVFKSRAFIVRYFYCIVPWTMERSASSSVTKSLTDSTMKAFLTDSIFLV